MRKISGVAILCLLGWLLLGGNVQQVVQSIVTTTCTNQFVRSLAATGAGTCASVANADLANSAVTVNGSTCTLGATCTPAIVASKITQITSSQTITRATGIKSVIFECVGSGGGGGGAAASATGLSAGGGGGAGGYARAALNTPAADYVVTIGAAGAAGATGANAGGNGNATTVVVNGVTIISAAGGTGGNAAGANAAGAGGAGGTGTTGNDLQTGGGGSAGLGASISTLQSFTPQGGASRFGGPGIAQNGSGGATNGSVATAGYGAGGSGGVSNASASTAAGGVGGVGACTATELTNQ